MFVVRRRRSRSISGAASAADIVRAYPAVLAPAPAAWQWPLRRRQRRLPVGQREQRRQSVRRRSAACRPATTGSAANSCLAAKPTSSSRRRRHVRAVEVLQSLVRDAARARRLRHEQRSVLRHPRPGLWRLKLHEDTGRARRDRTSTPAGPAALGMEVGFTPNWTAKVEYLYVDLGGTAARSPASTTAFKPTFCASA